MNRALACAAAAVMCTSCESRSPEPVDSGNEGSASAAVETGWPVHGGTTTEQRFSPLAQINKDTIADLKPAGPGAPTADSLSWNGRDSHGDLVRSGVYVYEVKGEGRTITGTVVVAK